MESSFPAIGITMFTRKIGLPRLCDYTIAHIPAGWRHGQNPFHYSSMHPTSLIRIFDDVVPNVIEY